MLNKPKHYNRNERMLVFVLLLMVASGMVQVSVAMVDSAWYFDDFDVVGNHPLDNFSIIEGAGNSVTVSNTTNRSANNSLYINDTSSVGSSRIAFTTSRFIPSNTTVNFSVNLTDTNISYFYTYGNTSLFGVSLRFYNHNIYYYDGSYKNLGGNIPLQQWNNISLDINHTNKSFKVTVNDTLLGTGLFREAAVDLYYIVFETPAGGTTDQPKLYVDNISISDQTIPDLTKIRKFPYPYRAGLAISSDIDETSWREFYDIYDFLNTGKNITGLGNGVNLESSQNTWMKASSTTGGEGDTAGCYYYNNGFTITPLCQNSSITLDYLKSGYIDSVHNLAASSYNLSTSQNTTWLLDVYSVLGINNVNITTWINHGDNTIVNNLGVLNTNWQGDNSSNVSTYHLNRTKAQGLRYYNEQGRFSFLNFDGYPMLPQTMKDNSTLFSMFRNENSIINPNGAPVNQNFSDQINESAMQQIIRRNGYDIVYTHLGMNWAVGDRVMNPVFDAQSVSNLRNLSDYYHGTNGKSKQIYVTTLAKLMKFAEVTAYLNYTYDNVGKTLTIYSVNNSVGNWTPTISDLQGVTFYVPTDTHVFIGTTEVTSSVVANPADEMGEVSIMFPITRLSYPYPNISSVGSYQINSSGDILWNRSTTRPAISQNINITILPSLGSVNFTANTWNTVGDYHKTFTASSNIHVNPTTFTIGDLPANTRLSIKVDGVQSATPTTNGTGYITFTYTGGYSPHDFDISILALEALDTNWCNPYESSPYGALQFGTILTFVIGAALLFYGFREANFTLMIAGVAVIVGSIVALSIGAAIISRMLICQ